MARRGERGHDRGGAMRPAPAVSLVLVAHRSSALLPAAVTAFRRELGALGLAGEVVVVEQSDDAEEADRAAACAPDLLLRRENRGYAAGVNAGVKASGGDVLLVANPDVELCPGALALLLDALSERWDVVGPQFELAGALFPPADEQRPAAELRRRLALTSRRRWHRHLRSELRRWDAVWTATAPRQVPTLSGALLAFRAGLAARVGPWDEGFFLYFEETDWLRRARLGGARLAIVPQARAIHRWGHAARAQAWAPTFAASHRRYFDRWFPLSGPLVRRLPRPRPLPARPWSEAPEVPDGGGRRWLLSPAAEGFPAALVAPPHEPEAVAAAFVESCGLDHLLYTAVESNAGELRGPYLWTSKAGPARTGAGPRAEG